MVGVDSPSRDVVRVHNRHGLLPERLELGLGRRDYPLRASGARRRPDVTHYRLLPSTAHTNVYYGLGLGCGCVGRNEIF